KSRFMKLLRTLSPPRQRMKARISPSSPVAGQRDSERKNGLVMVKSRDHRRPRVGGMRPSLSGVSGGRLAPRGARGSSPRGGGEAQDGRVKAEVVGRWAPRFCAP